MPILLKKHQVAQRLMLRDVRPASLRIYEALRKPDVAVMFAFGFGGLLIFAVDFIGGVADIIALLMLLYFYWVGKQSYRLAFKLPRSANCGDPHNPPPGKTSGGVADGILFLGNVSDVDDDKFGTELWLTNTDARTHILYLGTTGSGKTEGLKSMVTNALAWGSGYAYTDGKADTDLWASLYALARRFGRDDDLLVLNYMTGNSDDGALSNTMNPFSNGSASYLANMVVSFMPDAGGDNAMWKERAIALMFALMPALTYRRDKQGVLLDVGVVRDYIELQSIIRLSRDETLPERILGALHGYLRTLPGYVDAAFDDEGNERPPAPDQPMYDLQVARQQHGYLSMQFTRALQSLADEYGYIFKAQLADIDVLDVVLNRRIMIVLIPALEKSGEEAANLGKIVAASLKGMMGATLGNSVEGSWETAIGSKQTRSSTSFMTVFDEVGYYTAQGMAVMAAQARSLGFSLVFAAQDLPSMEKRVKQEAKSIVGNCNLKILGRIEDPTDTKEFVTRHGGMAWVMETKGMTAHANTLSNSFMSQPYYDDRGASFQVRQRVDYDHLRGQREGEAHLIFGDWAVKAQMFHAVPERVKALRVHRLLPVPSMMKALEAREKNMNEIVSHLKDPKWTAAAVAASTPVEPEISALVKGVALASNSMEVGPVALGAFLAQTVLDGNKTATKVAVGNGATNTQTKTSDKAPRAVVASTPGANIVAQKKNGSDKTVPANAVAQSQAAQKTVGTKTGSASTRNPAIDIPEIAAADRISARANLPPLSEGDQYALQEIEQAPVSLRTVERENNGFEPKGGDIHAVTEIERAPTSEGFSAADAHPSFNPDAQSGGLDDTIDLSLPEDLAAIISSSAKKLNKGLSGSSGK